MRSGEEKGIAGTEVIAEIDDVGVVAGYDAVYHGFFGFVCADFVDHFDDQNIAVHRLMKLQIMLDTKACIHQLFHPAALQLVTFPILLRKPSPNQTSHRLGRFSNSSEYTHTCRSKEFFRNFSSSDDRWKSRTHL